MSAYSFAFYAQVEPRLADFGHIDFHLQSVTFSRRTAVNAWSSWFYISHITEQWSLYRAVLHVSVMPSSCVHMIPFQSHHSCPHLRCHTGRDVWKAAHENGPAWLKHDLAIRPHRPPRSRSQFSGVSSSSNITSSSKSTAMCCHGIFSCHLFSSLLPKSTTSPAFTPSFPSTS